MKSSRVIDLERLQVCAFVAKRVKHAAEVARQRPGGASQDLRLVARAMEAVERHMRARERIKAVAERTTALARMLGISSDALRAAAAVDLMSDPGRVDALLRDLELELAQLEALKADIETLRHYRAMSEATQKLIEMIRQAGDRRIGVAPALEPTPSAAVLATRP